MGGGRLIGSVVFELSAAAVRAEGQND